MAQVSGPNLITLLLTRVSAVDSYIERSQGSATTADSHVAPTSTERSSQLYEEAKAMLTDFLRKTRASRRKGGGSRGVDSRKIDIVCLSIPASLRLILTYRRFR